MESEKASKIRKISYSLIVVNENKKFQSREYAKRCTKPDEDVRSLISMMHNECRSGKLSVMSG